jgi:hypothetical protein
MNWVSARERLGAELIGGRELVAARWRELCQTRGVVPHCLDAAASELVLQAGAALADGSTPETPWVRCGALLRVDCSALALPAGAAGLSLVDPPPEAAAEPTVAAAAEPAAAAAAEPALEPAPELALTAGSAPPVDPPAARSDRPQGASLDAVAAERTLSLELQSLWQAMQSEVQRLSFGEEEQRAACDALELQLDAALRGANAEVRELLLGEPVELPLLRYGGVRLLCHAGACPAPEIRAA